MNLSEVNTLEDLKALYKQLNLISTEDKIAYLKKELNIVALIGDDNHKKYDLVALEEFAIDGLNFTKNGAGMKKQIAEIRKFK